jgi:hypothetical protein
MARQNLMFQLAKVAVSLALLSGCAVQSTPNDDLSGLRSMAAPKGGWRDQVDDEVDDVSDELGDELGDLSVANKAGALNNARVVEAAGEEVVVDKPTESDTEAPPKPTEPGDEVEEEEGGGEDASPVPVDKSPIPKTDPQPDPQKIPIGVPVADPQPEFHEGEAVDDRTQETK